MVCIRTEAQFVAAAMECTGRILSGDDLDPLTLVRVLRMRFTVPMSCNLGCN